MNIKSTFVASATALALGAVVVNSSAAPALASEEPSSSHIAQIAAASEASELKPRADIGAVAVAAFTAGFGHAVSQHIFGRRAVDSTSALAATSDALFDYR